MSNDLALKTLFLQEALELLDGCELFSGLDRATFPDPSTLEAAQRAMHSLKGAARAVGFDHFAELSQEMEGVLIGLRSRELRSEALRAIADGSRQLRLMTLGLTEELDADFRAPELLEELRRLNALIPRKSEIQLDHDELGRLLAAETSRRLGRSAPVPTFTETLQKLVLVAEETARELHKPVHFAFSGDDTPASESVLEGLADPLLHLVRNAIDHGIESLEERVAKGKPVRGRVEVRVTRTATDLILECSDDGRGIDPERTVRKAQEKGFVRDPAARLTADEAIRLIFLPGFSTRDQVTSLSGRGIGMDVVREQVESLGGTVQVRSQPGSGTCFRLILPLRCIAEKDSAA